jgi:hypothetical protein
VTTHEPFLAAATPPSQHRSAGAMPSAPWGREIGEDLCRGPVSMRECRGENRVNRLVAFGATRLYLPILGR